MSESDEEVDDQQVQCDDLDAGSGSECLQLGSDWVAYLADLELPDNVSGVDYDIQDLQDFEDQESANV